METSKMIHLQDLNATRLYALYEQIKELKEISEDSLAICDLALIRTLILEVVNEYDIGTVTDVHEIFGGYINRSFGIDTNKNGIIDKYFVRQYKKDVTEKEIMFEHNLITCAIENGFDIAAGIIRTRKGKSFVKKLITANGQKMEFYYAIYKYLKGEDKYTWIENECTDMEYASSAAVMASFHYSTRNFDPQGLERVELKIMELLPTLPSVFKDYAKMASSNKFDEYFLKQLASIIQVINKNTIPSEDYFKMPCNPIHCDLHPGNLKFTDNRVVGIFDFDWSKIDLRLFDIGLALVYFCSSWQDELDGTLDLHKCEVFLKGYQNKLNELGGLEQINEVEKKYLPTILAAGNLYLIFWCLRDFYTNEGLNDFEYLTYLKHQVRLMNWIEKHEEEIIQMVNTL